MFPNQSEHHIIGISGKKRSGKNTVGQIAIDLLDYLVPMTYALHNTSFAEALKLRICKNYAIDNIAKLESEKERWRPALQFDGQFCRDLYGNDYWVDKLWQRMRESKGDKHITIITDVRYPNEAEKVRAFGGTLWRVQRPGLVSNDNHSSEIALDDYTHFNHIIYNDGTIEKLKVITEQLVRVWVQTKFNHRAYARRNA